MEPVYLSIQREAAGKRIRQLIREKGYSVRDIQEAMGFESPQAVDKWLSGKCLPNLDNFLILSKILHTSTEDILVVDGDIAVLGNERSLYRICRRLTGYSPFLFSLMASVYSAKLVFSQEEDKDSTV